MRRVGAAASITFPEQPLGKRLAPPVLFHPGVYTQSFVFSGNYGKRLRILAVGPVEDYGLFVAMLKDPFGQRLFEHLQRQE